MISSRTSNERENVNQQKPIFNIFFSAKDNYISIG